MFTATLASETEPTWLDPSDPRWVLERAETAVTQRREGEVGELLACLAWADLHAADPAHDPGGPVGPGGERLVHLGGAGSPGVRELSLCELAIALGRHEAWARHATADALDLRHRLPATWQQVQDLSAEVWVARRVASMTRALSRDDAMTVDAVVAPAIGGTAPSRLLDLAAAAVIEVDPERHRAKLAAQAERRFVSLGRPDDSGLRTLVGRLTAGSALHVDGVLERVAEVLASQQRADNLRPSTHDELRSEAMSWLADPAGLLALLTRHGLDAGGAVAEPAATASGAEPEQVPPAPIGDLVVPEIDEVCDATPSDPDAEALADVPPIPEPSPAEDREAEPAAPTAYSGFCLPRDVLDRLTPELLERLRPAATLYLHLHEEALRGVDVSGTTAGPGVVRAEGLPATDLWQLRALIGHHRVKVTPVIDNHEHLAVDAYEHPAWMRERIHLSRPADTFPHATRTGRALDLDHPIPWRPGGPPGQTTTDSRPLSRRAHRARTHLGYTIVPTPAGVLWRTPHGLWRLVDPHGVTHRLSSDEAQVLQHGESETDHAFRRICERIDARLTLLVGDTGFEPVTSSV